MSKFVSTLSKKFTRSRERNKTETEIQTEKCKTFVETVITKFMERVINDPESTSLIDFFDYILTEFTPLVIAWRKAEEGEAKNTALEELKSNLNRTNLAIRPEHALPIEVREVFRLFNNTGFDDNEFEKAAKAMVGDPNVTTMIENAWESMATDLKSELQVLVNDRRVEIRDFYQNNEALEDLDIEADELHDSLVCSDIFVRGLIGRPFEVPTSVRPDTIEDANENDDTLDWEMHIGKENGRIYFFNPRTGNSRREPPTHQEV